MGICQRVRLSIDANKKGIIMSAKESIQYLTDQKSCYKTPNEKLVFFYTGEITEIAEIGDIAK